MRRSHQEHPAFSTTVGHHAAPAPHIWPPARLALPPGSRGEVKPRWLQPPCSCIIITGAPPALGLPPRAACIADSATRATAASYAAGVGPTCYPRSARAPSLSVEAVTRSAAATNHAAISLKLKQEAYDFLGSHESSWLWLRRTHMNSFILRFKYVDDVQYMIYKNKISSAPSPTRSAGPLRTPEDGLGARDIL